MTALLFTFHIAIFPFYYEYFRLRNTIEKRILEKKGILKAVGLWGFFMV